MGGDIATDDSVVNAIILSLGIHNSKTNAPTWWGGIFDENLNGSRIHHIKKNTPENRQTLTHYINEALQWMVEGGYVKSIEVSVNNSTGNIFGINISFIYGSNDSSVDGNSILFYLDAITGRLTNGS